MVVGGWLEILVAGDIVGMDEGTVEGGRDEEREGKGDRPG